MTMVGSGVGARQPPEKCDSGLKTTYKRSADAGDEQG